MCRCWCACGVNDPEISDAVNCEALILLSEVEEAPGALPTNVLTLDRCRCVTQSSKILQVNGKLCGGRELTDRIWG